mgnify:FL=1
MERLLCEKRHAYSQLLAATSVNERKLFKAVKDIKARVKVELSKMRDAWWKQKACEIQAASDVKNAGLLNKLLRDVYGPTASMIAPVKSKDGKEMYCGSVAS